GAGRNTRMSVSAEAPSTPFKGLAAFQDTELDALLFYGREREREVVVANLLAARLTVLYGASGVGKTSLLRAAVVHSLRGAHDATVVLFSSWAGDPKQGLGDAIDAAAGIESQGTLSERLEVASRTVVGGVGRVGAVGGEEVRGGHEGVGAAPEEVAGGKGDGGRAGGAGGEAGDERIEERLGELVLERLWGVEREGGSGVLRV